MKELPEIIRVLYDASVEFILIGGVAMNLQGVAYLTQDIDFCYSRTPENLKRLARALEPYHARLRGAPPGLPFRLDAATLQQGMNFTLTTDLGDLDFLGEVTGLGSYDKVKAAADKKLIDAMPTLVLSVKGLIQTKKAARRKKDLLVLPELEALDELKSKTKSD
jgi:hypothetical protein